jgi:hypothetical protein
VLQFTRARDAWGTPEFPATLKREIEALDPGLLPLQQGLSTTSYVTGARHTAMIIASREDGDRIHVRAGVFYAGIVAGCSCADDPTPIEEQHEYCEILIEINKHTAEGLISLQAS